MNDPPVKKPRRKGGTAAKENADASPGAPAHATNGRRAPNPRDCRIYERHVLDGETEDAPAADYGISRQRVAKIVAEVEGWIAGLLSITVVAAGFFQGGLKIVGRPAIHASCVASSPQRRRCFPQRNVRTRVRRYAGWLHNNRVRPESGKSTKFFCSPRPDLSRGQLRAE
ncbi:MAG TPA: hypothetical protein VNH11_11080 [Pirellulales bacterium]|nr:hypothetical protein [Pirellulales bacterium]